MAFALRRAIASGLRVRFTHIGPILRVAVVVGSGEVVNARFCVHPDDGVPGTATARMLLGRELSGAGRVGAVVGAGRMKLSIAAS